MRRSLFACALLLSGTLLAGCQDLGTFTNDSTLGCDRVRSYSVGATINESLDTSDCQLNDGSAVDYYRVRVSSNRTLNVQATSNELDLEVVILDQNGTLVHGEDNGGQGYSELSATLYPGTYYIAASSYNSQELGRYQLTSQYY
ncbi:MAG: peptidase domain protein [Gemmatimonadetes bacterium]|nr:peptidase domain protein [Gemmatimonadota bacterium]